MAARAIRAGALVPLLEAQHYPERRPALAVYQPGAEKSPKIAVFLGFLNERFGREAWQLGKS
jgi:DNA-binding transcriptional LysR family regulator